MAKPPPNPPDLHTPDRGNQPHNGDEEPVAPTDEALSVDELANLLRAVVLVGIDHTTPSTLAAMFGLSCVRDRARITSDDELTEAARDVIRDALGTLGEGRFGRAARLLFGATDDTRGQTARERRRLAADQIDVMPDWFRRRYVPQIAKDVATEVLKIQRTATPDPTRAHTGDGAAVVRIHDRPTDAPNLADDQSRSGRRHLLTRVRHLFHRPDAEQTPVAVGAGRALTHVAAQPGLLQRVLEGLRDQQTRKERRLVWMVGGGVVFIRWGLDAVSRYVLVLAVLAASKTAADMIRQWRATRSFAFGELWPRLVLRVCVAVVAGGAILGQHNDGRDKEIPIRDCMLNLDLECSTLPADPHPSPNYTPTTFADPPTRATNPECPPVDNTERRLAFNGVPPLCINPDNRYTATIHTNYGHFTVTLNTHDVRYTVNNFVYLARWHYYDGVQLIPSPRPAKPTPLPTGIWTHLLSGNPTHSVTPEPANSDDPPPTDTTTTTTVDPGEVGVPGYTLTFEPHYGAYPDDQTLYVVMVNSWQPDQFAIIVTPEGHAQVADGDGAYPLVGAIEPDCRDVIAQRDLTGGWDVSPKSEAIVITAIDITEEPDTTPTTRPTTRLPNSDPCGRIAATRDH